MDTNIVGVDANTLAHIDALAHKLGTTAEYIFKVYTKQAFVEGIEDAIFAGALGLVAIGASYGLYKLYKEEAADGMEGLVIILVVSIVLSLIFMCTNLYNMIGLFWNPEYWALQQIFKSL